MEKETYYSECCGKYVAEEQEYRSKNILQVGRYKGNGKHYCSRCKLPVTKTGYVRRKILTITEQKLFDLIAINNPTLITEQ